MFNANPGSAQALTSALARVGDTIDGVHQAVDDFLAPITSDKKITTSRYQGMATGKLVADIEQRRGHCTEIVRTYVVAGGLRDGIPEGTDETVVAALDSIFESLSTADGDIFQAMTRIGGALENESAAMMNMLLARQSDAAQARLSKADKLLAPLLRDLNRTSADLNRLAGDLGLTLESRRKPQ